MAQKEVRILATLCVMMVFCCSAATGQPQGRDFKWTKPPEISATGWLNTRKPLSLRKLRKRKAVMLLFWSSW